MNDDAVIVDVVDSGVDGIVLADGGESEGSTEEIEVTMTRKELWMNILNIVALSLVTFCDFVIPFTAGPVIADLVVDFAVVDDKDMSGFYTGYVSLLPAIAQAFSSLVYAWLVGKVGTRPVLIVCQGVSTIFAFLLAFTSDFYYYVVFRTLLGLLIGLFSISLTAIGQRRMPQSWMLSGLTCMSLSANLAFAAGALLGGFLGRPVQQYGIGSVFGSEAISDFLTRFPMFLVYTLIGFVNIGTFILVFTVFEETADPVDMAVEQALDDLEESAQPDHMKKKKKTLFRTILSSSIVSRVPLTILAMYLMGRIVTFLTSMTIPVLLSYSVDAGGFGFSNNQIGIYGWIDAAGATLFALATPFYKYINIVVSLRILPYFYIIFIMVYPEIQYLNEVGGPAMMWSFLVIVTFLRQGARQLVITSVMLLVNNCVINREKGLMQGISGFVGYIGSAVGPYVGNMLLGVGGTYKQFPLDSHLCLIVASVCLVLLAVLAIFVPKELTKPVPEPLERSAAALLKQNGSAQDGLLSES